MTKASACLERLLLMHAPLPLIVMHACMDTASIFSFMQFRYVDRLSQCFSLQAPNPRLFLSILQLLLVLSLAGFWNTVCLVPFGALRHRPFYRKLYLSPFAPKVWSLLLRNGARKPFMFRLRTVYACSVSFAYFFFA